MLGKQMAAMRPKLYVLPGSHPCAAVEAALKLKSIDYDRVDLLPMSQLLRMGRGAVIPLDASESDEVWILANNHPVARGEIEIREDRIAITVTRAADVYDFMAGAA